VYIVTDIVIGFGVL